MMPRSLLLVVCALLTLPACTKGLALDSGCVDLDADGVCDPTDSGEPDTSCTNSTDEICNGLDDDCDGEIDEGVGTVFYADQDGDGYGDLTAPKRACSCPEGYVAGGGDCDDQELTTYPNAPEVCDKVDNDCDSDIDEDTEGLWYLDSDSDGFGDPKSVSTECVQPKGYVESAGDCDDTNSEVNPDATDRCGDGLDNDCSGADESCVYEGTTRLDDADASFYGDSYGERAGNELVLGDINGDGFDDLWVAARESSAGASYGGEAYLVYGPVKGSMSFSDSDTILYGHRAEYEIGRGIAIGDINNDGIDDVIAGGPHGPSGHGGGAYVLFGPPAAGDISTASADVAVTSSVYGDDLGHGVASGDFNGDGADDLAAGAYQDDTGALNAGTLYVFSGPLEGAFDKSEADAISVCSDRSSGASEFLSTGDVDGDGFDDLFPTASNATFGPSQAGVVYVLTGPLSGTTSMADATAIYIGESGGAYAGAGVGAGDVDGDGMNDLVIGSYGESSGGPSNGSAYVILGPPSGTHSLSEAHAKLMGDMRSGYAGWSAATSDVDHDGFSDIAVGGIGARSSTGLVWFVFGPVSGSSSLSESDARFEAGSGGAYTGSAVAFGDVDADGVGDLLIGAEYTSRDYSSAGSAYLVYGQAGK